MPDVQRSNPAIWHSTRIIGENRTFMGEEEQLRQRGLQVEVLQDETCIELMRQLIANQPALWNEDIGS